jgi:hypothetical protein
MIFRALMSADHPDKKLATVKGAVPSKTAAQEKRV